MTSRLLSASLWLAAGTALAQVPFVAETSPIPTATAGDLAIVRQANGDPPLIAAGDPIQNGLYVYALDGGLQQVVAYGAMRGIDSRTDLRYPSAPGTVVAAAAGVLQQVNFGAPLDGGDLFDVTATPVPVPTAGALALRRLSNGRLDLIADDSAGTLRRFSIEADDAGLLTGVAQADLALPNVPSALVVDDRSGLLYAAVPNDGVYQVDLATDAVDLLIPADGGQFGGLIAGLTFYPLGDGGGLLLTTVPSSDEVTVHALAGPTAANYVTRFRVELGSRVVRGARHVDVVPNRLPGFDAGLFVIHDLAQANYKLVPWDTLATTTPVALPIEVPEDAVGPDAGATDGGATDAGSSDGGTGGGAGGGGGGGSGSTGPGPQPVEQGCTCGAVEPLFFPGLLGLWILARSRRRRVTQA